MIVGIEDVTEKARKLKQALDDRPDITDEELAELGLVPNEMPFEVPTHLQKSLQMAVEGSRKNAIKARGRPEDSGVE